MIQEFERAVSTVNLPHDGLVAGDVGTVVDITNSKAVTLEFFNFAGKTVAVVTVGIDQVCPVSAHQVMHARERSA